MVWSLGKILYRVISFHSEWQLFSFRQHWCWGEAVEMETPCNTNKWSLILEVTFRNTDSDTPYNVRHQVMASFCSFVFFYISNILGATLYTRHYQRSSCYKYPMATNLIFFLFPEYKGQNCQKIQFCSRLDHILTRPIFFYRNPVDKQENTTNWFWYSLISQQGYS